MAFAAGILLFGIRLSGLPDSSSDGHAGQAADAIFVGAALFIIGVAWLLLRKLSFMNRELGR
jgi:hypothetical protein